MGEGERWGRGREVGECTWNHASTPGSAAAPPAAGFTHSSSRSFAAATTGSAGGAPYGSCAGSCPWPPYGSFSEPFFEPVALFTGCASLDGATVAAAVLAWSTRFRPPYGGFAAYTPLPSSSSLSSSPHSAP